MERGRRHLYGDRPYGLHHAAIAAWKAGRPAHLYRIAGLEMAGYVEPYARRCVGSRFERSSFSHSRVSKCILRAERKFLYGFSGVRKEQPRNGCTQPGDAANERAADR